MNFVNILAWIFISNGGFVFYLTSKISLRSQKSANFLFNLLSIMNSAIPLIFAENQSNHKNWIQSIITKNLLDIWTRIRQKNLISFEFWILEFYCFKKKIKFFASFLFKCLIYSLLSWIGFNFYDYSDFQQKIRGV